MQSSQQLRIHLFGHLRITFNDQPVAELQTDRLQSLLAYFVLQARSPHPRAQVATLFWSDVSETKAKANLRRELHRFKKVLPEADQFLRISSKTVQWLPQLPFWSDVTDFETTLEQAAHQENPADQIETLQQAVALYTEDLLLTCFDDWIEPVRDRLRGRMVRTLVDLSHLASDSGDYRSALACTQRLLTIEPLNEPAYLRLMQLYAHQGERASALQLYHQCTALLNEELDITPSAKIRLFYEQLLANESSVSRKTDNELTIQETCRHSDFSDLDEPSKKTAQIDWGEAPDIRAFCGRTEELAKLRQWIGTDTCRLVAVLGMGGIGKTALAAKLVHEIQADFDFIIWRSLCNAPPLITILEDLVLFLSNQQENSFSLPRLMHWLRQSRCLIVLDNVETIFKGREHAGQYRQGYENYGELLSVVGQSNHQSRLLLTSREKPSEIARFADADLAVQSLQLSGSPKAALALIEAKQLVGDRAEKEQLCERYDHNPLSLQLISSSIHDVFAGEIALFLAEDTLILQGTKRLLDRQFERLTVLEKTVMNWLAINRDWTSLAELNDDIHPDCDKAKLIEALESLCWRSLIEQKGNTYTQQSVIMEYVANNLIDQISNELTSANCLKELSYEDPNDGILAVVAYALIKTTVKDFIRESQERLLLQPVADYLMRSLSHPAKSICTYLQSLRSLGAQLTGYSAGNLMNLGRILKVDFTNLDLSDSTVYQAYLQNTVLHKTNFTRTNFRNTVFNQPLGPICSIAYSPDGTLLATGEGGGRIVLWRVSDQKPVLVLQELASWIMSLAFSHDSRYLISEGSRHQLNIWEVATGQRFRSMHGHTDLLWTIDTSPYENWAVSGGVGASLILWDFVTGKQLHQLTKHTQEVHAAKFSSDGQWIVSISMDKTICIWSSATGELLQNWQWETEPRSVSCSPDGKRLAVGNNKGEIALWNIQDEHIEVTLQAHSHWVLALAFSSCGRYLVSGSADSTTKLWNVKTAQLMQTAANYHGWTWALAFSPDDQSIAVGSNHEIRLWEMPKKKLFKLLKGHSSWVTSICCHPNRPLLVSGSDDCQIRLWNIETRALARTLKGHTDWVGTVAFSPCGSLIASGSTDTSIKLWKLETGEVLRTFQKHKGLVSAVSFSSDGKRLLSSSYDRTLCLWNVATGEELKTIEAHSGWISSAQFSPDGKRLASSSTDGTVKLWDAETGTVLIAFPEEHTVVWDLTFSPDGKKLITGREDATIKLWDVETGELVQTLAGHPLSVSAIAVSPCGQLIASGGDDTIVKLWNAHSGNLLHTFDSHQGRIETLSFTPDSQRLASGSADETIRLWDVLSGECLMTLRAPRPYEDMNISGVQGLTEAQKKSLKALGAVENELKCIQTPSF